MDSQFYFTVPLKHRFHFIKVFSQKPVYDRLCELNEHLMNNNPSTNERKLRLCKQLKIPKIVYGKKVYASFIYTVNYFSHH